MNGREKLEKIIDEGRANVETALLNIMNEANTRKDYIVRPEALSFEVNDQGIFTVVTTPVAPSVSVYGMTRHARNQLLEKVNIPLRYADYLTVEGEYTLLKQNLDTLILKQKQDGASSGVLIRTVGNTIKGFLSSAYKRMNAGPIFEGFVRGALAAGYVPYRGCNTDYRYHIGFLYPRVYEPVTGEHVVFGIAITTSDYGGHALTVEMFILRIRCMNLALGYDIMRKVHIGQRFVTGDDGYVHLLSDRTHELDTQTVSSATQDLVAGSSIYIEDLNRMIAEKAQQETDARPWLDRLKKQFTRKVAENVGPITKMTL